MSSEVTKTDPTTEAGEISSPDMYYQCGRLRDICERDDIKLHSTIPYHRPSNDAAECVIEVLTNVVRAMLHDSMTRACRN